MNEVPIPGKAARGGNWSMPAAPAALAGELEELRRSVVNHLDSLESLALQAGARTADRHWAESSTGQEDDFAARFENDRLMLAEAWERLERERIESAGARPGTGPAAAPRSPRPGDSPHHPERPAAHAVVQPVSTSSSTTANPVADAILRQFQTLCSDVRRTTDARLSSR